MQHIGYLYVWTNDISYGFRAPVDGAFYGEDKNENSTLSIYLRRIRLSHACRGYSSTGG
jgi:hypothetical protein